MNYTSLLLKAASATLTLVLLNPLASLAQSLAPVIGVDGIPTVTVTYGDLNLNKPAALELLLKRLKNAASATCAQYDSRDLARRAVFNACIDHAVAGAVIQTRVPALALLYTEKTGHMLTPSALLTAHR